MISTSRQSSTAGALLLALLMFAFSARAEETLDPIDQAVQLEELYDQRISVTSAIGSSQKGMVVLDDLDLISDGTNVTLVPHPGAATNKLWSTWPQLGVVKIPLASLKKIQKNASVGIQILLRPKEEGSANEAKYCRELQLICAGKKATLKCNDSAALTTDEQLNLAVASIYIFGDSGWARAEAREQPGSFDAHPICSANLKAGTTAWLEESDVARRVSVTPKTDPPQPKLAGCKGNPSLDAPQGALVVLYSPAQLTKWKGCKDPAHASPTSPRVCMPTDNPKHPAFLEPNRTLDVFVVRPRYFPSQVSGVGAVQVTPPQVQTSKYSFDGSTEKSAQADLSDPADTCVVDRWTLGPRGAGSFAVKTELFDSSGTEQKATAHLTEFAVEPVYIGAIRVGVAAIMPFGQNETQPGTATYSVRTGEGGNTIHRDSWSPFDLDLIAGYTAFFTKRRATEIADGGFGVFSGLGILSVSSTTGNVTGLTSGYLGLEGSAGGFALELLAGVKRVNMLADGYHVDSGVGGTTVPMTVAYRFAAGLAVSYSADVFKFAGTAVP